MALFGLSNEQNPNQNQNHLSTQYTGPYQSQYPTLTENSSYQLQNQPPNINFNFEATDIQTDNIFNQPFDFGNSDDLDMFSDLPLDQIFSQNLV